MKTPYEVLGVAIDATIVEIKAAFRKLAADNHPDRNKGSVEVFQQASFAYEILGDNARRAAYDRGERYPMSVESLIEARANAEAMALFSKLFAQLPAEKLPFVDFKSLLVSALESAEQQIDQKHNAAKRELNKLKIAKRRLLTGEFIFQGWIKQQRDAQIKTLRAIKFERKVATKMHDLFETINYDFTEEAPPASYFDLSSHSANWRSNYTTG